MSTRRVAAVAVASLLVTLGVGGVVPSAAEAAPKALIVLDPDDDVGRVSWPGVGTITELPLNDRLAQDVKKRLEDGCKSTVVVTRDGSRPFVSQEERKATALAADPDLVLTLAFNTLEGTPWGVESDGGPRAYAPPDGNRVTHELFVREGTINGIPTTP